MTRTTDATIGLIIANAARQGIISRAYAPDSLDDDRGYVGGRYLCVLCGRVVNIRRTRLEEMLIRGETFGRRARKVVRP